MNVAPDQTIISGLQIFLDHKSVHERKIDKWNWTKMNLYELRWPTTERQKDRKTERQKDRKTERNWEQTWPVPKVLKILKTEPNIGKQLISLGPSI